MSRNKIQVFEYESLFYNRKYNGVEFREDQFDALVKFNDRNQNKYFKVIHHGIRFSQYVGIIQVGNILIEILPKADRCEGDQANKQKWHDVLLTMIRTCRLLKIETLTSATLKFKNSNILDLYIEVFLNEVEKIIHHGLSKKYREHEENLYKLKGCLNFHQQLKSNLIHKERFYVRYQIYDIHNSLNKILYKTLSIIPRLTTDRKLLDKIGRLNLYFPTMNDIKVTERTFDLIKYDRKIERYREALKIAKMILLNYCPDIKSGLNHLIAILFDMNKLFEEYIYRQLKKDLSLKVLRQSAKIFWGYRRLRPDIVIIKDKKKYVIDTKWKILTQAVPSDDDLKQIFAYNQYFDSYKGILLYPNIFNISHRSEPFRKKLTTAEGESVEHECQLGFIDIERNGELNKNIASEIIGFLN
jgi:5-methylcytosine-specific restriction enzyme subunit McrC